MRQFEREGARGELPAHMELRPFRRQHMAELLEIGEQVGASTISR